GNRTPFLLEMPPYRVPRFQNVLLVMWDRGREFIKNAGTTIFVLSIILWFLASYPKSSDIAFRYEVQRKDAAQSMQADDLKTKLHLIDHEEASEQLKASFAGKLGHFIEPVIRPLGFDWKIGIGLVSSFAAREVLVSTLAIIYNVGDEADENSVDLMDALRKEKDPVTGEPVYTPLVAVGIMVFFVLACQCMSTVAIVKRETGGWGWPLFMVGYMTVLAWLGAFAVHQIGKLLGF
ncbi:MAG TPA: ferrous iron transport protein B, partial [Candidatus Omnitrophica bacterium]|nr:ferrous iron transport protein B [Candidatus Omnitrophota bacterium]